MGLSERKIKQRIGNDPRNLSWSDDKSRFSYKHMTALGWSDSSGIGGSDLSGNPNHIAVARKLDNSGIGMGRVMKEGDEMASGAGQAGQGLEDVLKRLAEAAKGAVENSAAADGGAEVKVEIKVEATQPVRNRIASRQRHLHSKRLASSSPAALAEILGVPVSSLPSTPTPASPSPSASGTSTPNPLESPGPSSAMKLSITEPERSADETISTSTLSVTDYFRQKMREKMLARQSASGSVTPNSELPESSLARVKDEVKVAIGGVKWEGSKVTFGESQVDIPEVQGESSRTGIGAGDNLPSGGESSTSGLGAAASASSAGDGTADDKVARKEAKRQRKAEKEARKAKKAAKSAAATSAPVQITSDEKEEKRKRKEEKKARKAAEAAEAARSNSAKVVEEDGKEKKKRKLDGESGEKEKRKRDEEGGKKEKRKRDGEDRKKEKSKH